MMLRMMGVLLCAALVACIDVVPQKDFNLEKVRERKRATERNILREQMRSRKCRQKAERKGVQEILRWGQRRA